MRRKYIVFLLTAALLSSPLGGVESYASSLPENAVPEGVVQEVYETTPVASEPALPEGVTQEVHETVPAEGENSLPEGVFSQVLETEPVIQGKELPEGVTQTVYETVPSGDTEHSAEAMGHSSMPDMEELDIHAEDVVSMVMPVIPEGTYDFTLDPQDLLSRYSVYKEDYEQASIYFDNYTGEKLHTGTSDAAIAKNKSSVPVLLYVSLEVENKDGWDINYTDMASVEENHENNISFSLIPVSVDGKTGEQTFHYDHGISIDSSGKAEMILFLPGYRDNFDQVGEMFVAKEDAEWSSSGFAVTGRCNTNGDWRDENERSANGETLKLHIAYRMDSLTEEQSDSIEKGLAPDPETGVIQFNDEY